MIVHKLARVIGALLLLLISGGCSSSTTSSGDQVAATDNDFSLTATISSIGENEVDLSGIATTYANGDASGWFSTNTSVRNGYTTGTVQPIYHLVGSVTINSQSSKPKDLRNSGLKVGDGVKVDGYTHATTGITLGSTVTVAVFTNITDNASHASHASSASRTQK